MKKLTWTKTALCLALSLVLMLAVSCGGTGSSTAASSGGGAASSAAAPEAAASGEKIKLKVLLMSEDEARVRVYNEMYAPNVEAAFPNYEVEFELPGTGYQDKLRIYNSSGELPDVFFGWNTIMESGTAANLTPYITEDGFVDRYKTDGALIPYSDGNIYAISAGTDAYYTSALFLNKALFEQEGIAVPTDFDSLLETVNAFTAKGYTPPISIMGSFTAYAMLPQDLVVMNNPSDMEKMVAGEENFGSDPFRAAMDKYEQLVQAGAFPKDAATIGYDEHIALFTGGKSPMLYAPLWVYASIMDMEGLDWVSPISFDQKPATLNGWGQAYGGYMVAKDSENVEAAVKLAEWMCEQDAIFFSTELGNAVSIDTGAEVELPPISQAFYELFNDPATTVIPNYASNYISDTTKEEMIVNTGKLLSGQMTAASFCDTMADLQQQQ